MQAASYLDSLSNVAHPSLAVDPRGGVHLALEPVSPAAEGGLPVQYAYCAATCLTNARWQVIRVGEAGLPGSEVRIRLNHAGQPRLLWFYQANWREEGTYLYAACDANCTQPANWQSVAVARDTVGPGEGRYFALDRQGNPRFFYTSSETGHSGTFYRYCLGSFLSAGSWREVQVSDSVLLGAFWLAFDAQNRLHVALSAEQEERSALIYLTCAAACQTAAQWQVAALGPLGVGYDFSLQLDAAAARLPASAGGLVLRNCPEEADGDEPLLCVTTAAPRP